MTNDEARMSKGVRLTSSLLVQGWSSGFYSPLRCNSPNTPSQAAPAGAKVFSQGRKPLVSEPHRPVSPNGAADACKRMGFSAAPSGLIGLGGTCPRGLRPWLTYLCPFGATRPLVCKNHERAVSREANCTPVIWTSSFGLHRRICLLKGCS